MARENTAAEYPELPFRLGDELDGLGRVIRIEQEGPGVYYVAAKDPAGAFRLPGEYYVVRRDSPAIPREAKTYGVPLPQYPMLLSYALDEAAGGVGGFPRRWNGRERCPPGRGPISWKK